MTSPFEVVSVSTRPGGAGVTVVSVDVVPSPLVTVVVVVWPPPRPPPPPGTGAPTSVTKPPAACVVLAAPLV